MSHMVDTQIQGCITVTKINQTLEILQILSQHFNINILLYFYRNFNIRRKKAFLIFLFRKRKPIHVLVHLEEGKNFLKLLVSH